jgi:hypothetical protein
MTVPYAFANLIGTIALSKLDSNFNTPITIGNTSVQLGNTVTTLNNLTLANVTITSGTSNVTNVNVTNINVTNVTATLANVTTLNVASEYVTASNVATAVIGNLTLSNALTVPNGGTGRVTLPVNNVLLGNGTGSIVSVAPGNAGNVLTSIGGVWVSNAAVVANSVTNVTATSPIISSGGTTPNLSFIASGTAGNVLTSIGGVWVSNAAVTLSAGGSTTQVQYNNAGTLAGSANLTFNGTTLTADTLNLANALGTIYGGTGLTSFTANGVVYASSSSVLATGSALVFNGTNLGIGSATPTNKLEVSGSARFFSAANGDVLISHSGLVSSITSATSISLALGTGNTERARFNTTGALVFAGGDTSANGIGITFPTTQSASTNANTLDDYEEGTWMPTIEGTTLAGTVTYGARNGRYTKMGRVVQIECYVQWSAGTGTGNLLITGLPFTSASASVFPQLSISAESLAITLNNYLIGYVNNSATSIIIAQQSTAGSSISRSLLPYDATAEILITGTYSV